MRVAAEVARKMLLAGVVAVAGPRGHLWWGEEYRGPGMSQWDVLLVVLFVSFVMAGLLLAAFVASGWLLRQRLWWQLGVDLALFGVALGRAVAAGVTARVVAAEPGAAADTGRMQAFRDALPPQRPVLLSLVVRRRRGR